MRKLLPVLFLLTLPVLGCGATAAEVSAGVAVGETVVDLTCAGLHKMCEATGNLDSKFCRAEVVVCADLGAATPVVGAVVESFAPDAGPDAGPDAPDAPDAGPDAGQ